MRYWQHRSVIAHVALIKPSKGAERMFDWNIKLFGNVEIKQGALQQLLTVRTRRVTIETAS